MWDGGGTVVATRDRAVTGAANAVRAGKIVALKGLGGFQLLVDATDDAAVRRLRARRHGDAAPFPVMCPDLECVQQHARLGADETQLLVSPAAPVVMVAARSDGGKLLAPSVAPGSADVGVMLPYTPLHVLLMRDLRRPIVAVGGHTGDAPPCIDEQDVVARLGGIADVLPRPQPADCASGGRLGRARRARAPYGASPGSRLFVTGSVTVTTCNGV